MLSKLTTAVALLASFVAAAPCTGKGDVIGNCNIQGTVALTYDDGPHPNNWERKIADTISSNGGKATFFLNGNNYGCIYDHADELRYLYEQGHVLGSHTWSHANVGQMSYSAISQELEKVETAFIKILGVKPLYFRPPYGSLSETAVQVLKDRGYTKIWLWDSDSGDSVGASTSAQRSAMEKVVNTFPNAHLVLQHSTYDSTTNTIVPWLAPALKNKGYRMVTANKCMTNGEDWPYQYVGPYGVRDSTWRC